MFGIRPPKRNGDDDENLMRQAFYVPELTEDPDLSKEPESAEEYLQRVRWEADRCEKVVVAQVDRSLLEKDYAVIPTNLFSKKTTNPLLRSTPEWRAKFLYSFAEKRQLVARLGAKSAAQEFITVGGAAESSPPPGLELKHNVPNINHRSAWFKFCFGGGDQNSASADQSKSLSEPPPLDAPQNENENEENADWSEMVCEEEQRDEVQQDQVLGVPEETLGANQGESEKMEISQSPNRSGVPPLLSILITLDQVSVARLLRMHISWFTSAGLSFTKQHTLWLYSLFVFLDRPVNADMGATLRSLLKHCLALRSDLPSVTDERLPALNMLIVITGVYFQQGDPETDEL